jgi:hypothetical protein
MKGKSPLAHLDISAGTGCTAFELLLLCCLLHLPRQA